MIVYHEPFDPECQVKSSVFPKNRLTRQNFARAMDIMDITVENYTNKIY